MEKIPRRKTTVYANTMKQQQVCEFVKFMRFKDSISALFFWGDHSVLWASVVVPINIGIDCRTRQSSYHWSSIEYIKR